MKISSTPCRISGGTPRTENATKRASGFRSNCFRTRSDTTIRSTSVCGTPHDSMTSLIEASVRNARFTTGSLRRFVSRALTRKEVLTRYWTSPASRQDHHAYPGGLAEHSLEIELPFLQRALVSNWKLLPVMVRARELRVSQGLGKALAQVLRGKSYVLVASTDLSHFYNQQTALAYDRAMLNAIESFDPAAAFDLERAGKGFACGLGAFTAVLWAAKELGADKVKVLRHATSGNVTGDYSSVVGYGAAVIVKSS